MKWLVIIRDAKDNENLRVVEVQAGDATEAAALGYFSDRTGNVDSEKIDEVFDDIEIIAGPGRSENYRFEIPGEADGVVVNVEAV